MIKEALIDKKVLFIDLDGTIVQTASKKTFPVDCCDFIIQKNVLGKIKEVLPNIRYLFIITNQNGIGKFISLEEFTAKGSAIWAFIKMYFKHIKGDLYYCDKNPSFFRKPNVGLLEEALDAYSINYIPKGNMIMIGDASGKEGDFSDSDKKCAENFEIDYIDVRDLLKM